MQNYLKKIGLVFFFAFLVVTVSFSGKAGAGVINVAEASFLDIVRGLVRINPLHVTISVPTEAELGKNFKAEVLVENRGEDKISNVRVEIFTSDGLVLINKNSFKEIGAIQGNKTKNIFWQVRGTEIGNFSISVSVSAEAGGNVVSVEGNTAVVRVIEKSSPPIHFSNLFQKFFAIFAKFFPF